ncbi:DNA translocase FtsK [Mesorhizobium sp. L-8-3]|uniref:DNA translocase FtsK n=1 Tax=Mesorhizobium sp. L-8-3 TaxID=2744522 RepID=UPI001927BF2C|nr:DNA translocase FtsK [Mesorhizobium sp. L-8-3]
MRFPRSNFSGQGSDGDGPEGHFEDGSQRAPRAGGPDDGSSRVVCLYANDRQRGRGGQPARDASARPGPSEPNRSTLQEHFFLAPNVRFTRTPDYEAENPRLPRENERPAAGAPASRPQSVATSAKTAPMSPPASRPSAEERPAPVVVHTAPKPGLPAAAKATALPAETPAVAQPGPVEPIRVEDSRWSYLSDHAFFELAEPDTAAPAVRGPVAGAEPPVVSAPATTAPAELPAAAAEITALFRVIECLPVHGVPAVPMEAVAPVVPDVAIAETEFPATAFDPEEEAAAPALVGPAAEAGEGPVREPEATNETVPAVPAPRIPATLPPVGGTTQPRGGDGYELPSEELLQEAPEGQGFYMSQERLEQNADLLESVLEDFGVRGEIIHVRPGPVVTLYEFEPAPGVKSSRVIGLADDIARSMSAISARVAVVPGRNVIGIELPNETRETVYFRELIGSDGFRKTGCKLALGLGKTIGGEPVIAELAKMPHLLVAGTTGSGKSVAINTMILSLLYRLKPEECRLIMVDPKMLELSAYDGIPHLLTPVVTDPKKAVTALKWAVREMEDRYRKMARLGVRNIDGYNQRAAAARDKGEVVVMTVQTGFEQGTGEPLFEQQEIDLAPMPYIVVIVDEMADLMMVAGKEIEGTIQRLAQMARAAGIHLIMATQRPSVDVITGTIKANFPTRISFQVTSKIDSRTILGEQGAEQLLGQGDMLHMAGGGRIVRVHGPFVSDEEVEKVVAHLKAQGRPEYLETVTADDEEEEEAADQTPVFDKGAVAAEDGDAIYDQAVKVVLRDKKCSTSYIQRRLGIGYNRAASLVERMEKEGLVGAPNHVGKREIIAGRHDAD